MRNGGHTVSRAMIAEVVWGGAYNDFSNLIEVFVNRLRHKIDDGSPSLITTVRGAGLCDAPAAMTLRLRLTIFWAAVFTLLLATAGVSVFFLFQRQQWARLDGALLEEADTSAQMIGRLGAGAAQAMVARLSAERDLGPSRRVWIVSRGKTIAGAGTPSADLPVIEQPPAAPMILNGRQRHFRYGLVPFRLDGADAYIVDGVDARPVRTPITRLRATLLLMLPAILLVSVSAGYWLAGRALAPLIEVTRGLAEIKPHDRGRRLLTPPTGDEVTRLVRAVNSLLARVERASDAERRFAADAAHELRTPLTLLRSGIEVALRRPRTSAEYADALEAALHDVVALSTIAGELLALARIDQELAPAPEPVDLSALAQEVIAALGPMAQAKRLTVQTACDREVIADGNRNYLRRLLINLVDNALKFTPEGGVIEVALERRDGHAWLRIADSGPGIAEADRPFIFDRFFRGRGRREAGNGLGLSLCREVVELHGGTLTAVNRVNGGAEFVVTLPAPLT